MLMFKVNNMVRYTYRFEGTATRDDSKRGVKMGDPDTWVVAAFNEDEAKVGLPLADAVCTAVHQLSKDWDK